MITKQICSIAVAAAVTYLSSHPTTIQLDNSANEYKHNKNNKTEIVLLADTRYTEEVNILAHLLNGEAGSKKCSDKMIYYVGSVVLNRIASDDYPDTLEEVIFQKGQYKCTWDGNYEKEITEDRYYEIAYDLLENGSWLPNYVLFQSEFEQGSGMYIQEQNMIFSAK